MDHDYGLAPNPFGQYCTLAVCKPQVRRNPYIRIGDWIIGFGSVNLGNENKLIYIMQIDEIISMNDYWNDNRFEYKKPILNGSLVQLYGDNFYHQNDKGMWVQENSAHSNTDGSTNFQHLETDTGGENVLISQKFVYFGDSCVDVNKKFEEVIPAGRGIKRSSISEEIGEEFIGWVISKYAIGIHGDPISWKDHKQGELFL